MTDASTSEWETVIGLEVHTELRTATKLFCSCRNEFGEEPNTNTCPVCLGLPGSLPVMNKTAVEYAMRIGTALECTIAPSVMSRKNYFYPDMPKDYQTSQYDLPINLDGRLELPDGFVVGIERAHIEEDTGKNSHMGGDGRISGAEYSLIDYNRSGVPLVEIVSRPDMRNSEQARAYVTELRSILVAIGASDGKMEEGSLRVDANVSVHKPGTPFGTRCEIKNVNSLRSLGRAIDYEVRRQIELIERGGEVEQQTRHWNENEGRTSFGRVKSDADDYRYFPEPDLVPVDPSPEWIKAVADAMPTLPAVRRKELAAMGGGASSDAIAAVVEAGLEEVVKTAVVGGAEPRTAINRAANELANADISGLDIAMFTKLLLLEKDGKLTATQAKTVLNDLLESGGDPEAIAAKHGFEALDTDALAATVAEVVAANPGELERLKGGEQKLMGFFVGKIMAATQGKADGKAVQQLLRSHLQ